LTVENRKPMPGGKSKLRLTLAVGALCSLAAVTAFGVAPLTVADLPPSETLLEPVVLQTESYDPVASFIQQETVRRGETLSSLMARLGVDDDDEFAAFVRRDPTARKLLQLRPGRAVTALVGADRTIQRLSYRLSGGDDDGLGNRLVIRRVEDRMVAIEEPVPVERAIEMRSVEVGASLIAAIDAADIPDNVMTRMADVFGDHVDFGRGVQRGDRLRVVYETLRESGSLEPPVVGRILALQFRSGSRRLEAVWFERADGGEYYTFDGRSLKRSFLASPLEFTRVSSGFTESRRHPVLRDWRAHKGIDLPAPSGTNVRSTADGVIEYIGNQRGYGNVIVVRHDARHTTLYAHLREFGAGLRVGSRVRQGDMIGKVGMTGWATGPHLHFEFHVDGQHVDPTVAVTAPKTRVLGPDERPRFAALASEYRAHFGLLDTQLVARFQ
jgi:murein DD-endopeptidase MepM/ murein hydrolase activator NlpD